MTKENRITTCCRICVLLSLPWLFSPSLAAEVELADPGQHESYQLGQGLRIGNTGFRIGGYIEAEYEDRQDSAAEVSLSSLSLFLWGSPLRRWQFFAELELEDALVLRKGDSTSDEAEWVSERLYVDYTHSDALKFRVGKFLTPVGRWNTLHAGPLTWTTSRPLITDETFPTNATGGMVFGVLPWTTDGVEYALYVSPGEEVFPEEDLDTFREAFGLRLAASLLPRTQVGFSYVNFEQKNSPDDHKDLFGVDFLWRWRRYEVSGEYAYRSIARQTSTRDEDGAYLQAVVPLTERLYAVGRYEAFHPATEGQDLQQYLFGLTYRYRPAVSFKLEYTRTTDESTDMPDGFLASATALF